MPNANADPSTKAASKQQRLKQLHCTDAHEQALRLRGFQLIAGVDEVGRGALLGPVVAAAVILPDRTGALARMGLKDSKQLTQQQREQLDTEVRGAALALAIAEVDAATIDSINIYQASRLAMLQAVQQLTTAPDHLLIDAMVLDTPIAQTKLIYGDALSLSIAAASVVAKVYRDALMRDLHAQYPVYGLAQHKGYGTAQHRRALAEHGPCPLHRMTFAPVKAAIHPSINPYHLDQSITASCDALPPCHLDRSIAAFGDAERRDLLPVPATTLQEFAA